MSAASHLFWKAMTPGLTQPGNEEALQLLTSAASAWRDVGKHFNAGHAMHRAHLAAWGDGEQVWSCLVAALQDYRYCVETQEHCAYESLLALLKWSSALATLYTYYRDSIEAEGKVSIARSRNELLDELAQRLITCFKDSTYVDSFLVKGFLLESNLEESWRPSFPKYEATWGLERSSLDTNILTIDVPSAFHLFVSLGDYQGASTVIERCPNAFTTPGLRGWKAAVQGFAKPDESAHWFTEAANAFSEDTHPSSEQEFEQRGSTWSSINVDLWAKYFRSRAALATAVNEPDRAKELIQTAATEVGDEFGRSNKEVFKYQILVQTLANLIDEESGLSPEQARSRFLRMADHIGMGEDSDDPMVLQFLTLSTEAFEDFENDPAKELVFGRLPSALDALARVPLIGSEVVEVAKHPVSVKAAQKLIEIAPADVFGPTSTWIYRTLESIQGKEGEDQLRKIILRIIQASRPVHAQIVHGPIEWGKDLIALVETEDHLELRMYQVKCGDMTTPAWRTARAQLEEMFQTPLPKTFVPDGPSPEHVGILIYNGHPKLHVAPAMDGWLDEQRKDHRREIRFVHLDEIVRWIIDDRLFNEFRQALVDVGLEPIE